MKEFKIFEGGKFKPLNNKPDAKNYLSENYNSIDGTHKIQSQNDDNILRRIIQ